MGAASIDDPQSFNAFSYSANDPVNLIDPTGLIWSFPDASKGWDHFASGFWGSGNLHGWGRRTGRDDIRDAEPRVAIFTFDMAENILDIWVESSMFDVDPQNTASLAPNGLASDRKLSGKECDDYLASIFGGSGAVVGSTRDPLTVGSNPSALAYAQKYGTSTDRIGERAPGHGPAPYNNPNPNSPDQGGIIHIYGNAQGTSSNTPLYAPSGGTVGPLVTTGSGNLTRRVSYSTGLSLSFVHVIPAGGPNRSGSVTLGTIGGPDSGGPNYRHTHIVFFNKGNRVDPRRVFCGQ
jgi:hypothetical protein